MRRVILLAVAGALAAASPAYATTIHVPRGGSVQRAIDSARPGDTIVLERGSYRGSLEMRESHITLDGNGASLLPPRQPANTLCNRLSKPTVTGVCVAGEITRGKEPKVRRAVRDVEIRDLTIERFSGDGVFAFGSKDLVLRGSRLLHNGGYGAFSNTSSGTQFVKNRVESNGAPGLYVGDSPHAGALVRGNRSLNNHGEGILVRSASTGRVTSNVLTGNCAGLLVLADAPGPANGWSVSHNRVSKNNRACKGEPDENEPPMSGIGIALLGAGSTRVEQNTVLGNVAAHPSLASGGIVVAKGVGGTPPAGDTVRSNTASGNTPADVLWDGSGSVTIGGNNCKTSQPAGGCTS
jgi:nitrous oxidase accessory protein NosD